VSLPSANGLPPSGSIGARYCRLASTGGIIRPAQANITSYCGGPLAGSGLVLSTSQALNIAIAASIFASPTCCFVALIAVAVGSILRLPTHQLIIAD
jgi:hypothetical protein